MNFLVAPFLFKTSLILSFCFSQNLFCQQTALHVKNEHKPLFIKTNSHPSISQQQTLQQTILQKISAPSDALPLLKKVISIKEGLELLKQVTEKGPFKIAYHSQEVEGVGGLWNGADRILILNKNYGGSYPELLQTLIIELNNALTDDKIHYIWQEASSGRIDKEEFVKRIEAWEHQNLLAARHIIEQGIQQGAFPRESAIFAFNNFDTHYMLQQIGGHSQRYANDFDKVCPPNRQTFYRGTLPFQEKLSEHQERQVFRYLQWRDMMLSFDQGARNKAYSLYQQELNALKKGMQTQDQQQRLHWLCSLMPSHQLQKSSESVRPS